MDSNSRLFPADGSHTCAQTAQASGTKPDTSRSTGVSGFTLHPLLYIRHRALTLRTLGSTNTLPSTPSSKPLHNTPHPPPYRSKCRPYPTPLPPPHPSPPASPKKHPSAANPPPPAIPWILPTSHPAPASSDLPALTPAITRRMTGARRGRR